MLIPFSTPLDFSFALKADNNFLAEEWYIFLGDKLLVRADKKSLPEHLFFESNIKLYLGAHRQKNIYAASINDIEIPLDWTLSNLRELYSTMHKDQFSIAGRALQLIDWNRTNLYCGKCGASTFHRENERCLECSSCKLLSYPKLAPAIMALIKRDNKILLARSPHFPASWYSILAGYVDPGETLEQCVAREVFEEVGLRVKNITYFGSQPWPLSRSLMIAFTCDWHEGEINIDSFEIEHADWFDIDNLPYLPPYLSIARFIIDSTCVRRSPLDGA